MWTFFLLVAAWFVLAVALELCMEKRGLSRPPYQDFSPHVYKKLKRK